MLACTHQGASISPMLSVQQQLVLIIPVLCAAGYATRLCVSTSHQLGTDGFHLVQECGHGHRSAAYGSGAVPPLR